MAQEFSLEELRKYDGTGPDGRIFISLDGTVYDVTTGE
jgi:membrane-associated progesterone receptor component